MDEKKKKEEEAQLKLLFIKGEETVPECDMAVQFPLLKRLNSLS